MTSALWLWLLTPPGLWAQEQEQAATASEDTSESAEAEPRITQALADQVAYPDAYCGKADPAEPLVWMKVGPTAVLKRKKEPRYPFEAWDGGWQGVCVVVLSVDTRGRVDDVKVAACTPGFEEATIKATRRWRFERSEVESSYLVRIDYCIP